MIKIRNWPQPQLQRGNICYAITGFLVIVSLSWKCHCSFNLLGFQFVVIGFNWGQFVGCDPNINENRKQSYFYFLDGLVTKKTNFQSGLDGVETSLSVKLWVWCQFLPLSSFPELMRQQWNAVCRFIVLCQHPTWLPVFAQIWTADPQHIPSDPVGLGFFPSILTHALGHAISSPSPCDSLLETQEHKEKTGWCLTTQL